MELRDSFKVQEQNVASWVEMLACNHFSVRSSKLCKKAQWDGDGRARSTEGRLKLNELWPLKNVAVTNHTWQLSCSYFNILNKCKLLLVIPVKLSSKMYLLNSCVSARVEIAAIADTCNKLHLDWHPNGSRLAGERFPEAPCWLSSALGFYMKFTWVPDGWTVTCLLSPFTCGLCQGFICD